MEFVGGFKEYIYVVISDILTSKTFKKFVYCLYIYNPEFYKCINLKKNQNEDDVANDLSVDFPFLF